MAQRRNIRREDTLKRFVVVSAVIHAVVLSSGSLLSGISFDDKQYYKPVIVDIEYQKKVKKPAKKKAKAVAVKKTTTVTKKKKTTAPRAVTYKPTKDSMRELDESLKALEEKIERRVSEEKLAGRIEELESKSTDNDKAPTNEEPLREKTNVAVDERLYNAYYELIAERVRSAWIYPGDAPEDYLQVLLNITITPVGDVTDVKVARKSGNTIFDSTALKAVKKASPMPPLPKEFGGEDYIIGFRFCPKECK